MAVTALSRATDLFQGFRDPTILALGLTQTIGYGSLFYAYGVLAPVMAADFGVGLDWFFAAFSFGLLLGGLAAPIVGRELDRRGARPIMAAGSLVAAAAAALVALAPTFPLFVAAVIVMEVAACLVLYEAAFAGLTQIHGHQARSRITAISLIAGFASTIFWPLTQQLAAWTDWRTTFLIYAAAHATICAPLHWTTLRRARPVALVTAGVAATSAEPPVHHGEARSRALTLYTVAICVSGIVYSAFPVHMLRIIENEGFSAESAALIAMVMGPAQVLARIVEVTMGHRFDALWTGRVALAALVGCVAVLVIASGHVVSAIVFAALYGVSQGLMTIARGTVPLQLFGVRGYATLVGRVTGLRFVVNAFGPFIFALIVARMNTEAAIAGCGLAAAAALATFLAIRRPV